MAQALTLYLKNVLFLKGGHVSTLEKKSGHRCCSRVSEIKSPFGRIPGSRASLFIDAPNLENSLLKGPRGNVREVVACSYRGCTH